MSPRCIVLSERSDDKLARAAFACLASIREREFLNRLFTGRDEPIPSADVLIVPVEAGTMQRVADLLARVRREAPRTSALVVGADLTQEQVLRVLTAGAYDFVSAPYLSTE